MGFDLDANDQSLPVLRDLMVRLGDIARMPSATRGNDGLVIHDPDAIRHVLLTRRTKYVKGAGLERVRMLLGHGLIVSDGSFWARQRKMVQPAFQSQAIRGFAPLVERINKDLLERWNEKAGRGETIDITHDLSVVSLDIVLRSIFGLDLDRIIEAQGGSPFDLLTRDSRRDLTFAARFRGLTRFVRGVFEARRRERRVERDFLAAMMQARDAATGEPMSDRELVDEVMTLIVAGHETTASTLNWTWYLLSQHPDAQTRLAAEIAAQVAADRPDAAPVSSADPLEAGSTYAERVLQEALRLYPPVWLFSRRAIEDDCIAGHDVPKGTDIFICPYLLHRHAAHWKDPEDFDPDRFSPAVASSRHRFAFLPFSAGPRFCVGAGFAMAEMAAHLRIVASRFRVHYTGPVPAEPEFQINLRSRHPLHMRLVPS